MTPLKELLLNAVTDHPLCQKGEYEHLALDDLLNYIDSRMTDDHLAAVQDRLYDIIVSRVVS